MVDNDVVSDDEVETILIGIELKLKSNPQYKYARDIGQLGPLTVCKVSQPLHAYIAWATSNGASFGDIKIPALRPETHWLNDYLDIAI